MISARAGWPEPSSDSREARISDNCGAMREKGSAFGRWSPLVVVLCHRVLHAEALTRLRALEERNMDLRSGGGREGSPETPTGLAPVGALSGIQSQRLPVRFVICFIGAKSLWRQALVIMNLGQYFPRRESSRED